MFETDENVESESVSKENSEEYQSDSDNSGNNSDLDI